MPDILGVVVLHEAAEKLCASRAGVGTAVWQVHAAVRKFAGATHFTRGRLKLNCNIVIVNVLTEKWSESTI